MRRLPISGFVIFIILGSSVSLATQAQPSSEPNPLAGAWTLNKEVSEKAQLNAPTGDADNAGRRRGGGMGGGMGGGRGGGMGRGHAGGNRQSDDATKRMRDAMRDIMTAPENLTIVQTQSMIVVTSGDGRVTRLSADGKKIKDENTGIERRTKWDAGKLVSEVTGLGSGKIIETYAIDPERHQLLVTLAIESPRPARATPERRVYDKTQ